MVGSFQVASTCRDGPSLAKDSPLDDDDDDDDVNCMLCVLFTEHN